MKCRYTKRYTHKHQHRYLNPSWQPSIFEIHLVHPASFAEIMSKLFTSEARYKLPQVTNPNPKYKWKLHNLEKSTQ